MTAVVAPRAGANLELADAVAHLNLTIGDPVHTVYVAGFACGFLSAFLDMDALTDVVTDAKRDLHAKALPYPDAAGVLSMLPLGSRLRSLRYSGVLFGWKTATAERHDAWVCVACDGRILFDLDTEAVSCRFHGSFCDMECAALVCDDHCRRIDDLQDGAPLWWPETEDHR